GAEQAHMAAARAEADRREGLARLAGQVDTMRTRVESIDDGVMRLSVSIEEAATKAQQTQAEFETVQSRVGELDAGEVGLDEQHDRSVAALRLADERVAELQAAERAAERQVASLRARIEALSVSLDRRDGAAWLQKNHSGAGLFGTIGEYLKVQPGHEVAVAAVLGAAADALAAEDFGVAAAAVAAARDTVTELNAKITALTDALHRDEMAKAQASLRIEQLEAQVLEQFGMPAADLIAEYGPQVALPPSDLEMAEYEQARERGEQVTAPAPMPFDRPTQERRAKKAERELSELGRVNPLALEEFAALEERYNFLSTQLEDVKAARTDLLDVIADVDNRILQVFTEAYVDVEREFEQVFSTLFPGGEGRLLLTDPSDMLTTGIEVEARPPGKKIKRLSLLSGGEKSLTAVAMLVAIFRARPSPFYVMDEVEAALDDVNLRRLISLFEQLREKSQLIVITHQKPTMEVADALYGVTMRGDGITSVISQRMRGQELAPTSG
ncbi:AAA family ATPase, partial [Mycolicibacterium houstonense]|uniref:AAA family ATPase n=1 Tax=Mycolicibacterium houstonense TaxID=146021 RepID=UPI00135BAF82